MVVGLVNQVRDATTLVCHANYDVMRSLVNFLVAECCTETADGDGHQERGMIFSSADILIFLEL